MKQLPDKFINVRECSVDIYDPTFMTDEDSYSRDSTKKAFSQRYDLELVTPPLRIEEAFELTAWLAEAGQGTHGKFLVKNPYHGLLVSAETRQINTREVITQGATSAPVKNLTPLIKGSLAIGSFFNFGNHPKVYMVTGSPNANASGQATFTFTPPCYEEVQSDTEVLYGEKCMFQVSLKADVQSLTMSVAARRRTPITLPLRERK